MFLLNLLPFELQKITWRHQHKNKYLLNIHGHQQGAWKVQSLHTEKLDLTAPGIASSKTVDHRTGLGYAVFSLAGIPTMSKQYLEFQIWKFSNILYNNNSKWTNNI